MSNRIVVYKQCKYHKRLDGELAESVCTDCRRLTFRATMKARGITVSVPTYKGGWSIIDATRGHKAVPNDAPGRREPGVFAFPERIPGRC